MSTLINVARVPFTCVGTYSIQGKFTDCHIPASTICSAMFNEFILQSFRLIHLLRKWKDCQKLLNQKFRNKNGKSYPTRIVKTPKFVQTCSFNISCINGLSCLYIFMKVWWAVSCCVHTKHSRTQSTGANYHGWTMKVVSCRKILWNALENDKNTVEVLCSNHLKYVIELCSSDSNDLSDD